MKRKFIKDTYLKGVEDYNMFQTENMDLDCFVVMKKINNIDKPYLETHTGKNICMLKDGYYLVEYLPKNENYTVRVFLDDNMDTISYYIDVVDKVGKKNNELFYDDLYLDITIDKLDGDNVKVWDEDELYQAKENNKISQETYENAYKTLDKILGEVSKETNKYVNNNHKKFLEKYFG